MCASLQRAGYCIISTCIYSQKEGLPSRVETNLILRMQAFPVYLICQTDVTKQVKPEWWKSFVWSLGARTMDGNGLKQIGCLVVCAGAGWSWKQASDCFNWNSLIGLAIFCRGLKVGTGSYQIKCISFFHTWNPRIPKSNIQNPSKSRYQSHSNTNHHKPATQAQGAQPQQGNW